MKGGHECVVYDRNAGNVDTLVKEGAIGASSLEDVVLDAELPSNELMKRILRDEDL